MQEFSCVQFNLQKIISCGKSWQFYLELVDLSSFTNCRVNFKITIKLNQIRLKDMRIDHARSGNIINFELNDILAYSQRNLAIADIIMI